jgi:hypothetical protein
MKTNITCAGCNKDSSEFPVYSDPEGEPVTADGSYANKHFVCDECFCELIPRGLSVGSAIQLQANIRHLRGKL